MKDMNRTTTWRPALFAIVGAALAVAGCGSSSSTAASSSPAAASSSAAASGSSSAAAPAVKIATAKGSAGTYLTGASGRAVYLWVADTNGKSACSGACAAAWPPVLVSGSATAGTGATAGDLGTTTRSDGSKQVTYKGHPLYYFSGDPSAGTTTGQGSDSFGAKWWLVSPSGAAIGAGSSSSGGSGGGSASSSSHSGSWS
jgi:predicted lipoprotein with Yx(FWY)xxD motif